jgi:hypothetical protein
MFVALGSRIDFDIFVVYFFWAHHLRDTHFFFHDLDSADLFGFAQLCQECAWFTWPQQLSPPSPERTRE